MTTLQNREKGRIPLNPQTVGQKEIKQRKEIKKVPIDRHKDGCIVEFM